MEKIIELYKEYGLYITENRAIPLMKDMLKPVDRRILQSAYDVARHNFTKAAKIVGHCIGNYHPHGDLSAYESLVKNVKLKLCDEQGSWGSKGLVDTPAAAMRYTETRLNKLTDKLAFTYIDSVPWDKFDYEIEPLYLSSVVPVGLIGDDVNYGIAFHTTLIPNYKIDDLIKRLKFLIGKDKKDITIYPNLADNKTTDEKGARELLKSGISDVIFTVNHKIISHNEYEINGIPYGGRNKIKSFCEKNRLQLNDYSQKNVAINIKGSNIVYQNFKKSVLEYKIAFHIYVLDDNLNVISVGVDTILLNTYSIYKKTLLNYLNKEREKLLIKKEEYTIILKIKNLIKTKNINTTEELIKELKSEYEESFISTILSKHSISSLININININSVDDEILKNKNSIDKIDDVIYQQLDEISKFKI